MSSSSRRSSSNRVVFRLSPLVMAIALISPLHSYAGEAHFSTKTNNNAKLESHRFHRDHILGTSLDVVITGSSQRDAEHAINAIEKEISQLNKILSIWQDDSEISQLNQQKQINASSDLYNVIAACERWRSKTCGAFDARLGSLIAMWQQANSVIEIDQTTRGQLVSQLQDSSVRLDEKNKSVQMDNSVVFAPDGYAKGYIIDRALIAARQAVPHLKGILIDIGGDMRVWGASPNQSGWTVGVQDAFRHYDNLAPSQVLKLKDQAVAFSGNGYRYLAGQSHLLDPKTGVPIQNVEQCVVVGKCAADADALATALVIMEPTEGMQLIESLVGYEAQLTLSNGETHQSTGWNTLVKIPQQADFYQVAGNTSTKWPAGYQAVIDLVIPKLAVENYRAPYVSVWVTDNDKKLVRTLAAWGKDQKWINSNYVWWRRYGRQIPNLDAVAKPSRQPGNYKLAWDGKDDNGKTVNAGQYQIHIETSREHGDHSYQTFNLDVKAQPSSQNLAAQKEIGAVKLNFQKVN
jgi:FAD:protein FMN transferase